jgi:hypothetical protein
VERQIVKEKIREMNVHARQAILWGQTFSHGFHAYVH